MCQSTLPRYPRSTVLDGRVLTVLWRRQRKLEHIELTDFTQTFASMTDRCLELIPTLRGIKQLYIKPSTMTEKHLVMSQNFLGPCMNLTKLAICRNIRGRDRTTDDVLPTMLQSCRFLQTKGPLRLRELSLEGINFARDTPDHILFTVIDFPILEVLSIKNCTGSPAFFIRKFKTNKLWSFTYHEDAALIGRISIASLEGLLFTLQNLRHINILLGNNWMPMVECITKHRKTLRSLIIESNTHHRYDLDELKAICSACTQLRQLGIGFRKSESLKLESLEDYEPYLVSHLPPLSLLPP